jgi:phosphate:Na+ symporter
MTLTQAIGVILGADIGTTITAWIVALDVFVKGGVLVFGLPILGLAGFFYLYLSSTTTVVMARSSNHVGRMTFGNSSPAF